VLQHAGCYDAGKPPTCVDWQRACQLVHDVRVGHGDEKGGVEGLEEAEPPGCVEGGQLVGRDLDEGHEVAVGVQARQAALVGAWQRRGCIHTRAHHPASVYAIWYGIYIYVIVSCA
jgi:hypothetical protein